MMTSAKVVESSVTVTTNSPSQDYTHPDDHTLPTYEVYLLFIYNQSEGLFYHYHHLF